MSDGRYTTGRLSLGQRTIAFDTSIMYLIVLYHRETGSDSDTNPWAQRVNTFVLTMKVPASHSWSDWPGVPRWAASNASMLMAG
jgi:hypothetical protein